MHAVVLLCPYSDSQSSELLSSDTSNPQHKTAHPHHHCLSTPSLPMTARKMIHSIPGPYSKSIIPPGITASAANACGFLLTPESKAPRRSTVASLGIAREVLPMHYERAPEHQKEAWCQRSIAGALPPDPQDLTLWRLSRSECCEPRAKGGCCRIPLNRSRPLSRRSGCFPSMALSSAQPKRDFTAGGRELHGCGGFYKDDT